MELTVQELADRLGGTVQGNGTLVLRGIATIQGAGAGDVTFLANKRYARYLASTCASAVIVSVSEEVDRENLAVIRVSDPYLGFLNTLKLFHAEEASPAPGVHPSAVIADDATVDETVAIGPNAVIAAGATIAARSVIGAGCVIDENVTIGEHCLLHPNVTILAHATIRNHVVIHSGTTIGSDGFGYAPNEGRYEKIPQIGSVLIEDNVEIGANTTIDRGTIGNTIIGEGTKIDNLVQIAHNVEIGTNTVVAAQSGISGSTRLGNNVIIAGQVGLVGHIDIGDNVTITAQSGVSKSVYGEGRTFRGSPAREIHEELKQEAAIRQLPDMIAAVRKLEKRISGLEKGAGEKE